MKKKAAGKSRPKRKAAKAKLVNTSELPERRARPRIPWAGEEGRQ